MGKRAKLFQLARDCVNVLACPRPNEILYERDFILNLLFCTRWKLIRVSLSLLDDLYKRNTFNKCDLHRFYQLNTLCMFQLRKYRECECECECKCKCKCDMNVNVNEVHYLQKVSFMVTTLAKIL